VWSDHDLDVLIQSAEEPQEPFTRELPKLATRHLRHVRLTEGVRDGMRALITAAIVVGLAWAIVLAFAWAFQRALIYFPMGGVPSPADAGLSDVEQVTFTTADGLELHGWFARSRESRSRFTLVVFNGNAGNRAYRARLARAFRDHGLGVLLFDYRGFGGNDGRPSEEGLALDARAAWAYLTTRADVDPARVAYFGESLGAAVALRLATEHPPAALVVRSPFTSLPALGRRHYPWLPVRWLLRDRYPNLERIAQIRCPLLVIAGERDSIVPLDQSRALYDAAPGPKDLVVVAASDHNDPALVDGPQVIEATLRLLNLH
jgi:uncharacterized protein